MRTILESEKLSIAQCRSILNVNGVKYTDDEIFKIREWLYRYAEITLEHLHSKTKNELNEIKEKINKKNSQKNENE